MKSKWWKPLRYAMITGTIIGCTTGLSRVLHSNLLEYHLYSTSARGMAYMLNTYLGIAILYCYALMAAWNVAGWKTGNAVKWLRACVVIVFIGILLHLSGTVNAFRDPEIRGLIFSFFNESMSQLLAAVACVVLGGFVLKRVRADQNKGRTSTGLSMRGFLDLLGSRNYFAIPFLVIAIAVNLTGGYYAARTAASIKSKPNIIFVMFDTCRADAIGCYGYPLDTSPNIDRFAQESTRFERAISQATITTASVGSFMTSRYPQGIFLENAGTTPGIPRYLPTLAEVLKNEGYNTSAVISNIMAQRSLGFSQGFDYFDEQMKFTDVSSPGVLSLGLKRIEKVKDKPFFMFMLFMDVHTRYVKHDRYDFYPGYRGNLGESVEIKDSQAAEPTKHYTADDIKYMRALYDGEIKFTDEHFGMLIDWLKKRGLYDNTLIVFLGDHGEEFMDHGILGHGHAVYDETSRVPLLIKLPRQSEGNVVHGTFPLIDLMPSILKYIGVDPATTEPHGSAVNLAGLNSVPDDYSYTAEETRYGKLWAIQNSRYKLIWNTDTEETQLFDLKSDRSESKNIAKSKPEVIRCLLDIVRSKDEEVGWKAVAQGKTGTSPEVFSDVEKERLRSLGYVQ